MFHVHLAVEGTCCNMCVFNAGIVGMGLPHTWHLKYTNSHQPKTCRNVLKTGLLLVHIQLSERAIYNDSGVHLSVSLMNHT